MDNSTTQSVKEIFGTDFQQYCLDHKLLLKKDKCDAFIVPNVNALTETTLILDKLKFKVNTRLKKLQKKERNNRQSMIFLNCFNNYYYIYIKFRNVLYFLYYLVYLNLLKFNYLLM
ncbi:hypothetical protein WH47_02551 [Habropoda laboriosa]|uniref:Uncharacterized protein n=1 Tax=Habropoda laboriosa TaxID=597456 RepID=A0A0L7QW61_9HYME|nr:hypothetical protein WH47_02551 [Habropoda laboriosa]